MDYVSGRNERRIAFSDYLKRNTREPASGKLHDQPFFLKPPLDLDRSREPAPRPLAVLFEQKQCAACDELHRQGFEDPAVRALARKFDFARLELFGPGRLVTPVGKSKTADEWGRELKVAYTPTFVFFDPNGREVFRVEAYLRPFHLASALDYVASGAYRTQPSFQRYIQARAEKIRAAGGRVDLW
jgi:thioredoxin-related protein